MHLTYSDQPPHLQPGLVFTVPDCDYNDSVQSGTENVLFSSVTIISQTCVKKNFYFIKFAQKGCTLVSEWVSGWVSDGQTAV